ncbi:MAG: pyruvate kinase [Candidatus Zambryskibacteria bacterium CG_4_9_14_3_um_filter_42_9]|uniref:Pyruvate kinase n=1 Tax=Candidatus Zambryskibacteria bacterium CG22_combo_CG10-13_8_21_14_all_42_17 TaxID=1975118 RepID=A0A2H0BDG5_9BACT|nr:MAG: pyruvate kinase [Candidatus Zambryskibacteria bacterium CG22_combo_CG10-13_8_21_14_all_42_17]PJA36669.1 MAG: pyruvate kinase [Candidatus Zambryskibacteria bacterium CG_4_9_14_3_um_filter_42_9]
MPFFSSRMKTKIIATIGPSSDSVEMLSKMIEIGMYVARMNFSHCTYEEYKKRQDIIIKESHKIGKKVLIMQDLQGPRIRVGTLPTEGRELVKDETVLFTTSKNREGIFIDEPSLSQVLKLGHPLYLSSGEMELTVTKKNGDSFEAKVVHGGILFSRKGVNVPETKLNFNGLTEKDLKDMEFGLSEGVDYIAVSFVQSGDDLRTVKKLINGKAKLVAKIETAQALKNIDDIVKESDAIMIARGDLGVEIPMEKVPFVQKNFIRHAHWYNKGAIVATQMLLSMVENKKPTRAEVSDVANAVLDGTDALMLSDETASGQYPLEALETMVKIAKETEKLFHETDNLL